MTLLSPRAGGGAAEDTEDAPSLDVCCCSDTEAGRAMRRSTSALGMRMPAEAEAPELVEPVDDARWMGCPCPCPWPSVEPPRTAMDCSRWDIAEREATSSAGAGVPEAGLRAAALPSDPRSSSSSSSSSPSSSSSLSSSSSSSFPSPRVAKRSAPSAACLPKRLLVLAADSRSGLRGPPSSGCCNESTDTSARTGGCDGSCDGGGGGAADAASSRPLRPESRSGAKSEANGSARAGAGGGAGAAAAAVAVSINTSESSKPL